MDIRMCLQSTMLMITMPMMIMMMIIVTIVPALQDRSKRVVAFSHSML